MNPRIVELNEVLEMYKESWSWCFLAVYTLGHFNLNPSGIDMILKDNPERMARGLKGNLDNALEEEERWLRELNENIKNISKEEGRRE